MDENSTVWRLAHSWWILISFIFLLNGLGLYYAGYSADEKLWRIEGITCELIVVIFIIVANVAIGSSISSFMAGIYIISWIISIIRSFMIRNKYLEKINHNKYQNTRYNQKRNEIPNNRQYNDKQQVNNTPQYNQQRIPVMENKENQQSNPIDFEPSNHKEEIEVKAIDINKASAEEISQLPCITIIQAKKIIQLRQSGRTIKSIDELKDVLELKDYQIEQIKKYIILSDNAAKNQRKLDL